MSKFSNGDYVRFKGDNVKYEITFVYDNDTYDLGSSELELDEDVYYVPARLLEPWPQEVKVGQVWHGHDSEEGSYRLFVTRVDGEESVRWAANWDMSINVGTASYVRDYHTLVLDA